MKALSARNVELGFGDVEVLRGVDLEIAAGELHVLLGESGSGKTTLLRAIAGFEPIGGGVIELFDQVVAAGQPRTHLPPERRKVGVVFQDYALFPHLDVRGNVAFGAASGASIGGLLEAVGLGGYERRGVAELSGGEQQRVALARALAQSPRLIVFDEPFSNLNRHLRERLRRQTADLLRERGVTALFVTHDRGEAFALADRLSVMDAGRILASGAPRALYERPETAAVARALGDCSLLPGERRGDRFVCAAGEVAVDPDSGGDRLLVRIEAVSLEGGGDGGEVVRAVYDGGRDRVVVKVGDSELEAAAPAGVFEVGQRVGVELTGPFVTVSE